jgi:hypothetical protein
MRDLAGVAIHEVEAERCGFLAEATKHAPSAGCPRPRVIAAIRKITAARLADGAEF